MRRGGAHLIPQWPPPAKVDSEKLKQANMLKPGFKLPSHIDTKLKGWKPAKLKPTKNELRGKPSCFVIPPPCARTGRCTSWWRPS